MYWNFLYIIHKHSVGTMQAQTQGIWTEGKMN